MTKSVYQFAHFLVLPLAISSTQVCAEAESEEKKAQTAAEMDWLPVEQMTPARRSEVSSVCKGGYVVPSYLPEGAPTTTKDASDSPMRAFSNNASIDEAQNAYFEGDVEILQPPFLLHGNSAHLDQQANTVTVDGDTVLRGPDMHLHALRFKIPQNGAAHIKARPGSPLCGGHGVKLGEAVARLHAGF